MGYASKRMPLNLRETIAKARQFCSGKARSQQELRDQLYRAGAWRNEVEQAICEMILEGLLSEEACAMNFAAAKFRKDWGKIKIRKGLRDKRVSEPLIRQALNSVAGEDYLKALQRLAEKWLRGHREPFIWKRKLKLTDYLMRQGFEYAFIQQALKDWEDWQTKRF